jgi:PKD repeat protein
LDVPTGGQFICSNSFLPMMSYASQSGYMSWSTNNNNIIPNSYIAADMNESPYRQAGIALVTNNLAMIPVDAFPTVGESRDTTIRTVNGWHLTNGNTNFLLRVTNSAYAKGVRPSVTIEVYYLEDTDGSLTVNYDSSLGMKLGHTYMLSSTNAVWRDYSFSVNDARFSGTNVADIQLIVSNTPACDPVVGYVLVSSSYIGVPPQLLPPPPVAGFSATPTNGIRPLAVTFTDASTGVITNLFWSFGDNQTTNTAAGAAVSHTYSNANTYPVTLIASGPGGSSTNTQASYITVNVPTAPKIGGISVTGNTNVLLTGSGGPTNGTYYYWVRSSTDLTLPLTNWNLISTNLFNPDGSFSNALPVTPGSPQQFYRLQLP